MKRPAISEDHVPSVSRVQAAARGMREEQALDVMLLGWQCGNNRMVLRHQPECSCAPRRANIVEEFYIRVIVVCPLFWSVVFIVDCFYGADRFARPAVNALIRVDV